MEIEGYGYWHLMGPIVCDIDVNGDGTRICLHVPDNTREKPISIRGALLWMMFRTYVLQGKIQLY
jgi:hypothetical protein